MRNWLPRHRALGTDLAWQLWVPQYQENEEVALHGCTDTTRDYSLWLSRVSRQKHPFPGFSPIGLYCISNVLTFKLLLESHASNYPLSMKVKEGIEKVGLKLNIQKTKIMASGPITSWQIDGETMESVTDFNFLDSKITTDFDCTHEIKRRLLLGRKVMTNLTAY